MRSTLAAVLIVVGMAPAAQAAFFIASPPAFGGGTNQSIAVCYYSNIGNSTVAFDSSQIFVEDGVSLAVTSDTCYRSSVPPNSRCRTVAENIPNNRAVWCRARVSDQQYVRGRLEIRTNFGVVLTSEEVR